MSTTIDQKVVEMRFDNRQFQAGVSDTMSSIQKLNSSLQFKGSTKGFENISDASKQTGKSLEDFEYASYKTGFRWSDVLSKISSVAEWNIARNAVMMLENSIKNLVNQMLGIDAAKAGFEEYGLKMGSIQTIMASTGEDLETVNGYLDELNAYSDKTIYSFSDMTQNIGKFTNAGVSLKDSVAAIQGVANVAALSGANSNEASRAMYNFSQALSAGYVKLIDWKSIENANMATVGFKEQLIETAVALGTVTKQSDGTYKTLSGNTFTATKNFNEVLQDQWMTSDVLTKTLANYADETTEIGEKATKAATEVKTFGQMMDTLKESAQSGFAQTWELIFGNFEEGKELWTSISNTLGGLISASAEARNEVLEDWKLLGGRDDLIASFKNLYDALVAIVKPIKEAFEELFPPLTAKNLLAFTKGLKEFTASLKISDAAGDNLRRTFRGIFAVLRLAVDIIGAVFKAVGSLGDEFKTLIGWIFSATAVIGDLLYVFVGLIESGGIINKIFAGVAKVIEFIIAVAIKVGRTLDRVFQSEGMRAFYAFLGVVGKRLLGLGEEAESMADAMTNVFNNLGDKVKNSTLFKILENLWTIAVSIGGMISKAFAGFFQSLSAQISEGDLTGLMDIINGFITGGIGIGLITLIKKIKDAFGGVSDIVDSVTGITDKIKDILGSVTDTFQAFQNSLNANTLKTIATAILILTVALIALTFVDHDKLMGACAVIAALFIELFAALAIYKKVGGIVDKMSGTMLAMAASVLILAVACAKIAAIESEDLKKALLAIGALVLGMSVAMRIMATQEKVMAKGSKVMLTMALTLMLLMPVIKSLGSMEWESLAKAGAGIAGALGIFVTAVAVMKKVLNTSQKTIVAGASAILTMAFALLLLVPTLKVLGAMSWGELAKAGVGMIGMIAILTASVVAMKKLMKSAKGTSSADVVKDTAAMVVMAAALLLLVPTMMYLGSLNWESMARIGAGLLGVLTILVGAVSILSLLNGGKAAAGAASVAIIAATINMLIPSLVVLSLMDWGALARTGAGLLGIVTILVAAVTILSLLNSGKAAAGAAAVVIMVVAINMLVPALMALSLMSWESIGKGLAAIAGAFLIMGAAGLLLSSLAPVIVALAAAMFLIGTATLAAGVGVWLLASGMTLLAGSITVLAAAAGGIVTVITAIVTGVIKGIGEGIIALCAIIASSTTAIADAFVSIIVAACDALTRTVPLLVDTLLILIVSVLDALVEYLPPIIDALLEIVILIIDGLAKNLEPLIESVVNLFMSLLKGVIKGIGAIDTGELLEYLMNVGILAAIMALLASMAILAPAAMVGAVALLAVVTELSLVFTAFGALAQIPGLTWIIEQGGNLMEAVGTAIGKFIGGIAGGIAHGVSNSLPDIATNLSTFMTNVQPFIDGAKNIDASVLTGVLALVGVIAAITAASILESITSFVTGENSIAKFSDELVMLGNGLKGFSDVTSGINTENVTAAANAAKALAQMTSYIPNSGGIVSWFTGENSIAKFSAELVLLGLGLKGFATATAGINSESVTASANAAKALAEMTSYIPNSGGIVSWFAGDNSIAKFGAELVSLGIGLKGFAMATVGINAESMTAAANAAKTIAQMTSYIPNSGGVVSWFTGENSIAKFSAELVLLGLGIKGFATATAGINTESTIAAANAAKTLAEMTSYIPNSGGVVSWFTGEQSISKFGFELVNLGVGLKGFATATAGINTESVTAAAGAAKTLAEMTACIPNSGGVMSWLSGDNSISKFSVELVLLGNGLKGFATATAGINPENVTAAANAAKALAEMTSHIPSQGGIKAWFTGENNVATFGGQLPKLGAGLKGFSDSVSGINPENITAASKAAKTLAEMTKTAPSDSSKIVSLGENLKKFGASLKVYYTNAGVIKDGAVNAAKNAITSINKIAGINSAKLESASSAINKLTATLKNMAGVNANTVTGFKSALNSLGKTSVDTFVKSFDGLDGKLSKIGKTAAEAFVKAVRSMNSQVKKAGQELGDNLIDGVESKSKSAKSAASDMADDAAKGARGKYDSFRSSGSYLVSGFALGIRSSRSSAISAAISMATAALNAAKEKLREHSPSKAAYEIGDFFGLGFVNAIGDYESKAYNASSDMAGSARSGLSDAISKIRDFIDGGMDVQPTIRPVLDLSDVKAGANAIGDFFGAGTSVGVLANVGSISSMMNRRSQNGSNADVVSALDELRKDLSTIKSETYNINGVTYDDGSNITEAVKTLVRAARIERRV